MYSLFFESRETPAESMRLFLCMDVECTGCSQMEGTENEINTVLNLLRTYQSAVFTRKWYYSRFTRPARLTPKYTSLNVLNIKILTYFRGELMDNIIYE